MKSPRRIRTEKEAFQFLQNNVPTLRDERRRSAIQRIKLAKQPNAEAKRIVEKYLHDKGSEIPANDLVDLSDVQELHARLIRRDGIIAEPHSSMLSKLELDIVTDGISPQDFKRRSALILSMEAALPKDMREREAEYLKQ